MGKIVNLETACVEEIARLGCFRVEPVRKLLIDEGIKPSGVTWAYANDREVIKDVTLALIGPGAERVLAIERIKTTIKKHAV